GSVGAYGGDVRGVGGVEEVCVRADEEVLSVRRPVVLDREVERERQQLGEVASVETRAEEPLSRLEVRWRTEQVSVEADEAKRLPVRGDVWVGRESLPVGPGADDPVLVAAVGIHAPDRVVEGVEVEMFVDDFATAGRKRRLTFAATDPGGQADAVAPVGVDDIDGRALALGVPVVLVDDAPSVR